MKAFDARLLADFGDRAFQVLGFSGLALIFSLTMPVPALGTLLLGAAAGLLALALLLALLRLHFSIVDGVAGRLAARRLASESSPAFLTDRTGIFVARNMPADRLAGPKWTAGLEDILSSSIADPAALTNRLRNRAVDHGSASEEINLADEPHSLSATQLSADRILWRLEGQEDLIPAKPDTAPEPANIGNRETHDDNDALLSKPGLLEALPVPMLKIAADGTLIEANREARSIFSLDATPLPPLFELVEGMGRPISDWLRDAAEGRGLLKPEIVRAVVPGQELFLQIALGRTIENDKVVLVGILNDATELKTLEAQFVQSQKMQAIGQLAGGVAHDFNNLLTAISGHCDLLLLRHDQGDPDYADLIQISQNANRAASLVGQLLAFSRKQNLKPQALDLRDTMSELAHLLNRLIGERIQLDVMHDPGAPVIRADRRQLEQVIINLVVNARDAMPDGGRIRISTRSEVLDEPLKRDRALVPPGNYVVIDVKDTGTGIGADGITKIFEPFYTTKKTGEGTGLGLSTAYGIVKQTGGFIFVDSTPGQGTHFSLYFPAADARLAEVVPEPPRAPRRLPLSGDGVVLLVEDEAPVRAFASRALRMHGYTVIEAADAEEALATLDDPALHIDIFVTDVVMPNMDGPTWVRQALKRRPDTRVVFMSGYAEEGRAEKQARTPNSVFLPKPFSLHQLTALVQEQLN
jgi:two-component system, cell cycle sensor histidine kinase and response regulator CckA